MKYGLMYDGEVIDVFTPPAGKTINDCFTDDRASEYVSIPAHVTVGYTQKYDGSWIPPTEPSVRPSEGVAPS